MEEELSEAPAHRRYYAEVPVQGSEGFGEINVLRGLSTWDVEGAWPEFPPNTVVAVDVTDLDPRPELGYIYNPEDGTFSPP